MSVNRQPQDEIFTLEEQLSARKTVEARFRKFGVGEEDSTWIMGQLSDEVLSSLLKLDLLKPTLGERQSSMTMFDEEVVGLSFFLNNPAMLSKYLGVEGDELKKSQRVMAMGALFSDLGKVSGEGEMTWLYDNFYLHGNDFKAEMEKWKMEPGFEEDRKNAGESPMLLPWEKAKEIFLKINFADNEQSKAEWIEKAEMFEQKMVGLGWEIGKNPELTFGEIMTRAHLQELSNKWDSLAKNLDPDVAGEVKTVALNHHLVSGFPIGEDNVLTALGETPLDEREAVLKVKQCLMSQLSDAIIASLCRQRRPGDEYHTEGLKRMQGDLVKSVKKKRIPSEDLTMLMIWVSELPKDTEGEETGAVEAGVREILVNGLQRTDTPVN